MILAEEKLIQFELAIKTISNDYIYCKANIEEEIGEKISQLIGIQKEFLPQIYIIQSVGNDVKKYKLNKEITSDNIIQFEIEYSEGKLQPIYKSEPIPENNNKNVIKIVGDNFYNIVFDQTKDVFVLFHAPWQTSCKIWGKLFYKISKKLKNNSNIILAKYDRFLNENIETIDIVEFPTMLFYPSNDKQNPIPYQLNAKEGELLTFLKDYTTFEWIENDEIERDEL